MEILPCCELVRMDCSCCSVGIVASLGVFGQQRLCAYHFGGSDEMAIHLGHGSGHDLVPNVCLTRAARQIL